MLTIVDPLEHAKIAYPDRVAVVDGDTTLTFAQLHERCARLGAALKGFGLAPGDRVAVLANNGHRYLEAFFGIPAAGLVMVPLNTRLAERELRLIVSDCTARVLLTDRDPGEFGNLFEHVVRMPEEYDARIEANPPMAFRGQAAPGEDTVATLFYTGGTTGLPKGVMLTHRNLVSNAFHKALACSLTAEDTFLAAPAMFHVAGIAPLLSLVWLGGRIVTVPAFDPDVCLDVIANQGVTVFMPVPTMLDAVVRAQLARPRDVSTLRMLGHAGAPISNDSIEAAHAAFPEIELTQFYGATETASVVTTLRFEERAIGTPLLGSCGRAVPGTAVRVIRRDGSQCDEGEVGEVVVRGPNVSPGYFGQPEESAKVHVDGWYHTGDLGFMGVGGYLFLVDRKKDMIVSGAENVYSIEVEDMLYRHPSVLEAAVFGIPDPKWGEAVHAVVVVREADAHDPAAMAETLKAHCRKSIAGYKVPKRIDVQTEPLPKSGPGKILKRVLREPFWKGLSRNSDRSPS